MIEEFKKGDYVIAEFIDFNMVKVFGVIEEVVREPASLVGSFHIFYKVKDSKSHKIWQHIEHGELRKDVAKNRDILLNELLNDN